MTSRIYQWEYIQSEIPHPHVCGILRKPILFSPFYIAHYVTIIDFFSRHKRISLHRIQFVV